MVGGLRGELAPAPVTTVSPQRFWQRLLCVPGAGRGSILGCLEAKHVGQGCAPLEGALDCVKPQPCPRAWSPGEPGPKLPDTERGSSGPGQPKAVGREGHSHWAQSDKCHRERERGAGLERGRGHSREWLGRGVVAPEQSWVGESAAAERSEGKAPAGQVRRGSGLVQGHRPGALDGCGSQLSTGPGADGRGSRAVSGGPSRWAVS